MNNTQKHFIGSVAKGIVDILDSKKLTIEKASLRFEDMESVSKLGIKVDSDSRTIVDNMPYVEYELVKVSQRIFERPISNQPFTEMLYADAEGSTDSAIIYKYIDYKGGFTASADKSSSNTIVSTKHGAESYTKVYMSAYLEDVSLYEIAVAMSKGLELNARMLKALYVAYTKTMNTVIFAGKDSAGTSVGKYSLNDEATKTVSASTGTWEALINANNGIQIYKDLANKMATMEENGELSDGQFTPNRLVLPIKQYGLLRTPMENAGYFNGTIMEYIEQRLNLTIETYAPLKEAGAGSVARALLLNNDEINMFYGLPNPLTVYEDQKFDINSKKSVFQTTGLIVVNGGSISAIDGI